MKPLRVALIGFDDINAMDLVGPAEAFASAFVDDSGSTRPGYTISILGLNRRLFRSESGIVFKPHQTLEEDGKVYFKGWDEWDHHSVVIEEGGVGFVRTGFKAEKAEDIAEIAAKAQL